MLPVRLETNTKYYTIHLTRDLFNDLVLVCDFGSKLTSHHHRLIKLVSSELEAQNLVEKIIKTRYRHGYDVVNEC